jgi:hypothetical protein
MIRRGFLDKASRKELIALDGTILCGHRVGCTRCNRRWSVTAGTMMTHTKLPLATWFRAMHAMTCTKQGISAVELGRRLGVSYPTVWYLHKRLRHAMTERESRYVVSGPGGDGGAAPVVEADDVYLGGERNQGCGPAGKTRVTAAAAVQAFSQARLAPEAHAHTDGFRAFTAFATAGRNHQRTITDSTRPARQRSAAFFVLNTAIANLSTATRATHKAISAKHTKDYLGAFCWITNRRRQMADMVQPLCRAIASSSNLTRAAVFAQKTVPAG